MEVNWKWMWLRVRRTGPCHCAGSTAYSGSFHLLPRDTHCPRSHQCFQEKVSGFALTGVCSSYMFLKTLLIFHNSK